MSGIVDTSRRQYAVISLGTGLRCERQVIAYPDEKSLRDLLARPSIVALGYGSREEAQAVAAREIDGPSRPESTSLVGQARQSLKGLVVSRVLSRGNFRLAKAHSLVTGVVQDAFIAAIIVFYSKNVLSAAVRALISL